MASKTSVVIVNFNSGSKLARMLEALKLSEGLTTEVVVVDNASFDESANDLKQKFPLVRVATIERNAGFYAAARAGFKVAGGDVVVLCHPDLITTLHALAELADQLRAAGSRRVAAMVPRMLDSNGNRQPNLGRLPTLTSGMLGQLKPNLGRSLSVAALDHVADHEFATFACVALDCGIVQALGGIDAAYFHAYGDADLCQRMHDKAHRILISKDVTVAHTGRVSVGGSSGVDRILRKDQARYFEKHRAGWEQKVLGSTNSMRKFVTRAKDD